MLLAACVHCHCPCCRGAPSVDDFSKLWDFLKSGGAAATGLDEVGQQAKLQQMLWCLAEALWREDQHFLSKATCISLARDERHSRLVIMFAACSPDFTIRRGMFGLRKHFGSGSLRISDATDRMLRRMCTLNYGGPPRHAGNPSSSPKPWFNADLHAHVVSSIKVCVVDTATDEVAASACRWRYHSHCEVHHVWIDWKSFVLRC